ncbi:hypothetical protein CPC08DRAFT_738337 [Agrocybe pediades]|nr:hypothetical protein CPC08DRAFT_738337 [Agrocybe pediades]
MTSNNHDRRPTKRSRQESSYKDVVSLGTNYRAIHSREEALRTVSNNRVPARADRTLVNPSQWAPASGWEPIDDPEYSLDPSAEFYDAAVEGEVFQVENEADVPAKTKKKYKQGHGEEIFDTRSIAQIVLLASCQPPESLSIGLWTGNKFEDVSLKDMGLTVQLNHASLFCSNLLPCHPSLLILHSNGIHEVAIKFCGCDRAIPPHLQLLRRGLYPASQQTPKTCATFELLDLLHKLALTTKSNTYDFYRAIEKLTVNTGISVPKGRYRQLMRMVLQWRHLKLLKWGGRAHDPAGVAATKEGELAVLCPSCPRPGINLSPDWETTPEDMKFLFMAFICLDANFRLKNQLVSNYSQDPGLGIGWAYMLPREPYESYVMSRAKDDDISTCVGLQALAKASTKFSKGLRHTGVGGAFCGRSEMILPLGIGNLQKGERYANMDFIFGSALRSFALVPLILISYDIACQWFVNLFRRIEEHWPEGIKPSVNTKFIPAIPKLHEPMHGKANHKVYSLNFIPGVGESDLETPERGWAFHNALGKSTQTQAPGSRHDILDDHFNFYNWLKYISLGTTLMRKYKAALALRNNSAHLPEAWEKMCLEWEADTYPKKKPNPYQTKESNISEKQVRKELADDDESALRRGETMPHTMSASAFLILGLELEDIQRQLLPVYMPGIVQYRADQAQSGVTEGTSTVSDHPEEAELWLPSHIPQAHRVRICVPNLPEKEEKLRLAQCYDALDTIRHILKIKSRMVAFKNQNVRGQREGTRSRAIIDRVHERARAAAEKYRAVRAAYMKLTRPGQWEETLRVLHDGDLRSYRDPNTLQPRQPRRGILEDDQLEMMNAQPQDEDKDEEELSLFTQIRERRDGTGETRRTLSWIWTTNSSAENVHEDSDDILRAEWAKSRARAARAREEVLLLKEEMRRMLLFLEWKAAWWDQQLTSRQVNSKELAEGLQAYTNSQACLQRALLAEFRKLWKAPLDEEENGDEDENASDDDESDGEDLDLDNGAPMSDVE